MKKVLFFVISILSLIAAGGVIALGYLIFVVPGAHLDREHIKQSVLTESTVYYRDGKTKLGTFYSGAHRNYLEAPSSVSMSTNQEGIIPSMFFQAIVASEDQEFYNHVGISVSGIVRAAIANLKAGRVVQGGSSLTQQTAELLFEQKAADEWGRWKKQFMETLDAFRLEVQYSKDQILEFYTNLFHVHGTGQGLAIASRYYFDKSVSELNLAEIAFIAGSVKGPANYNPFRTTNPQKIESITKKATARRNYVLDNMLKMGFVSPKEKEEAAKEPVNFRKGAFRFQESHQMDTVRTILESEPWKSYLQQNGITDLTRAEINIHTTLDPNVQSVGEFALKRHLSGLEYRIQKYTLPQEPPLSEKSVPKAHEFYVGQILKIDSKPHRVVVQIGPDQGVVEGKLLDEFAKRVLRPPRREKITAYHHRKAVKLLKMKDLVLIATHGRKPNGEWILSIEQKPRLNGGVFVLQDGKVRALVGGVSRQGFNRALQAKRQPGSTFKLLVYLAALQLGWDPLEPLPNTRQVYAFQGQLYFPRPDHKPLDTVSSMVWAGAKSENLASVYLLVHLLDHLTPEQFSTLVKFTDLDQKESESQTDYQKRLRDQLGIIDTERHLKPGLFEFVRQQIRQEFEMDPEETKQWNQLFYGQGWKAAYKRRRNARSRQKRLERDILWHNYLRFQELNQQMMQRRTTLAQTFNENANQLKTIDEALLNGFYIQPQNVGTNQVPPLAFTMSSKQLESGWKPLKKRNLLLYQKFWEPELRQRLFLADNIWIDGKLRGSALNTAQDLMGQMLEEVKKSKAYSPERLYHHHDFRILLAMKTAIGIGKIIGVQSTLKPILSLPLGANEIALDELALMYQTYMTGMIRSRAETPLQNSWKLIDRIEDAKGNVIYQDQLIRKRVVSEETVHELQEILRSVVEYGTGRYAKQYLALPMPEEVRLSRLRIPAYGKTGTANNYTNATYAGFLPNIRGSEIIATGGYTITSYVGLDKNVAKSKSLPFKLSGASGALPVWSEVAQSLIRISNYQNKVDWDQLLEMEISGVLPTTHPEGYKQAVSLKNGLMNSAAEPEEKTGIVYLPPPQLEEPRVVRFFKDLAQPALN